MGVAAAVTVVAAAGAYSASEASQSRRMAGQRADAAKIDAESANRSRKASEEQETNRAFSKIARQRQRAIAAGNAAPSGQVSPSMIGSGSAGGPAPSGTGNKVTLGS